LVWHFAKNSPFQASTFKKEATWVFMCLVVYEFILSLRYFFWMYNLSAYPYLLITNCFLQSITCYLVCAVFTNQAFAATENQSTWIPRTLNALLVILLGIYTGISIIEVIPIADPNQKTI
jgi:hypothetical protein